MQMIDCTSVERVTLMVSMDELHELFYACDHAACDLLCAGASSRAEEFMKYAEDLRYMIKDAEYEVGF